MSNDKYYKRKKSFIDDPEWVPKDKGTNDTIIRSNSDFLDESKITCRPIHPRTAKKCLDYREKNFKQYKFYLYQPFSVTIQVILVSLAYHPVHPPDFRMIILIPLLSLSFLSH